MLTFTQTHIFCILFIILIYALVIISGFTIINRVFENIGNILNDKKLKKIVSKAIPSTTISLLVVQLIIQLNKLEDNDVFFIIGIFLLGGVSVVYIYYLYIHNKVIKELEYPYNKKEAFSIFMTLASSVLLYKWSKKCPSREDTAYSEELAEKRSVVSKKLIDDILLGKYGDGSKRKKALEDMGYDYRTVQDMVTTEYNRRKKEGYNGLKETRYETKNIVEKLKNEDVIISSGITEDMLKHMIEEVMEDLNNIKGRT